jgi:hypothetical protein
MQRIDTSTKAVDLFGSGKHGFQDGNPGIGQAATQLNAALFNNVQEELCRVIEAAGIALDGAVYTQLLSALNAGWGMAQDNTTSNASQRFPGGWILKTNRATTNASGLATWTFSEAFPNEIFIVLGTVVFGGTYYGISIDDTPTVAQAKFRCSVATATNYRALALGR